MATESSLAALAASPPPAEQDQDPHAQARRQYIRTLHRVIEQADVVVLVLDARDPAGCRSRLVEEEVQREGKQLVFVLNKVGAWPRPSVAAC